MVLYIVNIYIRYIVRVMRRYEESRSEDDIEAMTYHNTYGSNVASAFLSYAYLDHQYTQDRQSPPVFDPHTNNNMARLSTYSQDLPCVHMAQVN
jgi:hypothetical protein